MDNLFGNPTGWGRKVAGSKLRIAVWVGIHLALVSFGIFIAKSEIVAAAMVFIFVGVLYPGYYLYAIYRLLKIIDSAKSAGAV